MGEIIKVFIAETDLRIENKRTLLILCRKFLKGDQWDDSEFLENGVKRVFSIKESDIVLIPKQINDYEGGMSRLQKLNEALKEHNKYAYGYISGDYGTSYKEFSNIFYLRMGGFEKQLSNKNLGFPVTINDYYIDTDGPVYKKNKPTKPIVGFCGHASDSIIKLVYEKVKFIKININRFLKNPSRRDLEPLFSSAYSRIKILKVFEKNPKIETNFIYRKAYRAGAKNAEDREKSTFEYFENLKSSDYVFCLRGGGNFSVRFYEALMMGKIPVLVDTDCLLPFEEQINWAEHIIKVDWNQRNIVDKIVLNFHEKLNNEEFFEIQRKNRALWKEKFNSIEMIKMLNKRHKHTDDI